MCCLFCLLIFCFDIFYQLIRYSGVPIGCKCCTCNCLDNINSKEYRFARKLQCQECRLYIYILIEYILLSIVFESATKSVLALEVALGRCAKCRWQSGCLACDPYKCLRFHLHKQLRPRSRLSSAKD